MSKSIKMDGSKKPTMNVQTCEHFRHVLNPHIHECANEKNLSKRCGYEAREVSSCPLVGKLIMQSFKAIKAIDKSADKTSVSDSLIGDQKNSGPEATVSNTKKDAGETVETTATMGESQVKSGKSVKMSDLSKDDLQKIDDIEEKSEHVKDFQEAAREVLDAKARTNSAKTSVSPLPGGKQSKSLKDEKLRSAR